MKRDVHVIAFGTLVLFCWSTRTTVAAEWPHVLVILVDDMGYGDLGVQNPDSLIPTPHLDQLAREGMRFTDGHSSSSQCSPSRYALLTGRYHWRHSDTLTSDMGPSAFTKEQLTMPEMFQELGYETAAIGKLSLIHI